MGAMRKQFGLSLVELMISITLGLILMVGVMKLFVSSKVVFSTQQGLSRIQETGRLAVDFISHEISEAGYYGCHRPLIGSSTEKPSATDDSKKLQGLPITVGNGNHLHGDFGVGITGYMSATAAQLKLPHGVQNDLGQDITPVETGVGEDGNPVTAHILVIRSANQQGLILREANTGTSLTAYINTPADSAGCYSGVCPNSVAVAADCYKSRIFQVSNLTAGENRLTINHPGTWGGGANPLESFIPGAEVLGVNTNVYFLAEGAGGGPSLWQKTNTGAPVELVEGVEQMRITYATLTNNNYRTADQIANWSDVWSVRIDLVVRSLEDNVLSEPQAYTFAGAEPATPKDKRMRQIFTSTTAIRSRMLLN